MPKLVQTARTLILTDTIARPNDTTQYAVGDVISTAAGEVLTFPNAARVPGGGGRVLDVLIADSANQGTKLQCDLWLFDAAPAPIADNAALALSDAELLAAVAVLSFTTGALTGNAGAGALGNALYPAANQNRAFCCAAGSTTLYGLLVARNAYTPVADEIFTIRLVVAQE